MRRPESPGARRSLFLDCEFSSLHKPELLALALVDGAGLECYLQVDRETVQGLRARCSTFTLRKVLPLLEPSRGLTYEAMGRQLECWLAADERPMDVCYDFHADYDLLEAVLAPAAGARELLGRMSPTHVGYLHGDSGAATAAELQWKTLEEHRGLRRHHALADALALRAAFMAVHGAPAP